MDSMFYNCRVLVPSKILLGYHQAVKSFPALLAGHCWHSLFTRHTIKLYAFLYNQCTFDFFFFLPDLPLQSELEQ